MSGPSCKIYFNDETEYFEVTKIAALHDMQLPTFVRNATIAACNQYLAALNAQQQAAATEGAENVETGSTESEGTSASEADGAAETAQP